MEEANKKDFKKYYSNLIEEAISQFKNKNTRHKQIPNILSMIRLLAPFFIIPAAATGNIPLSLIFVIFFGLTDVADGVIARKWKLQSTLGADLDAVADKIFSATLLIAFSFIQPVLVINFLYELAIASINFKAKLEKQNPKSHIIGKFKTCLLYPLIGIGFLSSVINIEHLFNVLFVGTTITQTLTAITYLFKYRNKVKQKKEIQKDELELPTVNKEETEDSEKTKTFDKTINGDMIESLKELKDLLVHENEIIYSEKNKEEQPKIREKKQ